MKEVKAFVHRGRVGDIVHALQQAGFARLSVNDVKGLLQAVSTREQNYSIELGGRVIDEIKLEVFCEGDEVSEVVGLIRKHARTSKPVAGWVYLTAVEQAWPIHGITADHDATD
jgi:nitrogen regulatory protein P-II 1